MEIKKFSYDQLTQLSDKDSMYILSPEKLKPFFRWDTELSSFKEIIEDKSKQKLDRVTLANVLKKQYQLFPNNKLQLELIEQLKNENCFTVTTAHQPSALTGPLYYIFKIASVINLSKQLKQNFPSYKFIPCFVTGGEDHDFEEIDHLSIFGSELKWKNHSWNGGSVGQINLDGLENLLDDLCDKLGHSSYGVDWIKREIYPLLAKSQNYSQFARMLTHTMFGEQGLLVISMDDAQLKSIYSEVVQKEIFERPSEKLVQNTQEDLSKLRWKPQAHARNINFFYRTKNSRSRIVFENNSYTTIDNSFNWTAEELEKEIKDNPGAFSPNVIMRPLFQESILPNLAYIGGGGEIAYWLERKSQFEHFEIPFPMLIRRNSAMFVPHSLEKKLNKITLGFESFFVHPDTLVKTYLASTGENAYTLTAQKSGLDELMEEAVEKAKAADPTLENLARAEITKMQKSIETIEKKISKAIKRKEEVELNRISKIQTQLFPNNGLQERKENIFQFINDYGIELLDKLIEELNPLEKSFTVFFMQSQDLQNQVQKK